jgi:glycine zipper 2TM protein
MNPQTRKFLLCFGALALSAAAACNRDAKPSTPDILAQDSTLDLKVMAANHDSSSDTAVNPKAVAASGTAAARPTARPASPPVAAAPAMHPVKVASAPTKAVRQVSNMHATRVASARVNRISRTERNAHLASSVSERRTHRRASRSVYASAPVRATRSSERTTTPVTSSESTVATTETVVPAPAPTTRRSFNMVPTGSSLDLASNQKICTNTSKVGQQFETRLTKSVVGPDGVLIPEGTLATGRVASIGKSDPGIAVDISSLTFGGRTYPVGSQVIYTEVDRVQTSSRATGGKIVAGAGLGALLGRMIGGDTKSTVIGAVGGAAAGGVLANAGTTQYAHCVPNGGQIVARLTEPLRLASAN